MPVTASPLITAIADGEPWDATAPNGQSLKLTLNPDGTARMSAGLMSSRMTRPESAGRICLNGLPRADGPACTTPSPVRAGYQLTGEGERAWAPRR